VYVVLKTTFEFEPETTRLYTYYAWNMTRVLGPRTPVFFHP